MRLTRVKFKLRHLMVLVAVVAAGLAFESFFVYIADGSFPLQVDLHDATNHKVVAVAMRAVVCREWADEYVTHPELADDRLTGVPWSPGQSLSVQVPWSGQVSSFGRRLTYGQYHGLVVQIEYADGSSRRMSVAIPDGRVQRRVTVLVE
jgi:hypothetical protein